MISNDDLNQIMINNDNIMIKNNDDSKEEKEAKEGEGSREEQKEYQRRTEENKEKQTNINPNQESTTFNLEDPRQQAKYSTKMRNIAI